jgi:5'-nucleotidase
MRRPLILVTNDDGIESRGLWETVEALIPFGEILVVAPNRQWSGAGRCMPHTVTGDYQVFHRETAGRAVVAYAVDASPALAVEHGVLEFADRTPALVVSGTNFGANVSVDVTISGTVGAALEGASFGIPALAVSLEMDPRFYLSGDAEASYDAVKAYVQRFARTILRHGMPYGVDVWNLNLPSDATAYTPWRRTHLSRCRYFSPLAPDRTAGETARGGRPRYRIIDTPQDLEPNSDLHVLMLERLVSVTPLSLDLTARTNELLFTEALSSELMAYQALNLPELTLLRRQSALLAIVAADAESS